MTNSIETVQRARKWIVDGSGIPAHTVWAHMMGLSGFHVAAPKDVRDVRCIKELLEAVPEWRPRMCELASLQDGWSEIAPQWERLARDPAAIIEITGLPPILDPQGRLKLAYQMGRSLADWDKDRESYEGLSLDHRANMWVVGADTGSSSRSIWAAMLGVGNRDDNPLDPADLGRCLRLLEIIPEWKPRVPELAALSPEWKALADRWDDLATSMENEVGIAWQKGSSAPLTYDLMKEILNSTKKAA